MKNLIYSLVAFLLVGSTAFASTTTSDISVEHNRFVRSYGNSFIFVEQGIAEQDFNKGSVSHTAEQKDPWFVVDLGGVKDISTIKVFNRGDCCGDRLKDATVEIIDAGLHVVWTGKIEEAKDKSVSEFVGE